jgi:hypothetical protein
MPHYQNFKVRTFNCGHLLNILIARCLRYHIVCKYLDTASQNSRRPLPPSEDKISRESEFRNGS